MNLNEAGRVIVVLVLGVVLSGCWAGYAAPDASGQLSYGSSIVRMGAAHWDLPARDLDRVLGATDAGKIIQKSLIAHGGWDRWRSLTHVEYRRLRVRTRASDAVSDAVSDAARSASEGAAPPSPDSGETRLEADPEARDVVFDPRGWGGAQDEDASIFSLPFLLLRGGFTQEHLGAQIDITQDREFQKLRFVRSQDGDPSLAEEFVVYFDSFSGLFTQVLIHRAPGDWLLVRMSGWETVAGLRLATKRKAYRLKKMFQRPRPESLVWRDTLVDLNIR